MREALERLRAAFGGLRNKAQSTGEGSVRARGADELPRVTGPDGGLLEPSDWISSQPRQPRALAPIIDSIRAEPQRAVGQLERPAALGTLLEGALCFALDDVIDERCARIEVRLLRDGSAAIEHAGPGFAPARCVQGCRRWPWLRRSPEGEIMLTRSLAAPVVTCALSHWMRVEISREDGLWRAAFYRGQLELGLTRDEPRRGGVTYTRISFRPDAEIFGERTFSIDDLYLRGLGLLLELPGVEMSIYDERTAVPPLVVMGTGGAA